MSVNMYPVIQLKELTRREFEYECFIRNWTMMDIRNVPTSTVAIFQNSVNEEKNPFQWRFGGSVVNELHESLASCDQYIASVERVTREQVFNMSRLIHYIYRLTRVELIIGKNADISEALKRLKDIYSRKQIQAYEEMPGNICPNVVLNGENVPLIVVDPVSSNVGTSSMSNILVPISSSTSHSSGGVEMSLVDGNTQSDNVITTTAVPRASTTVVSSTMQRNPFMDIVLDPVNIFDRQSQSVPVIANDNSDIIPQAHSLHGAPYRIRTDPSTLAYFASQTTPKPTRRNETQIMDYNPPPQSTVTSHYRETSTPGIDVSAFTVGSNILPADTNNRMIANQCKKIGNSNDVSDNQVNRSVHFDEDNIQRNRVLNAEQHSPALMNAPGHPIPQIPFHVHQDTTSRNNHRSGNAPNAHFPTGSNHQFGSSSYPHGFSLPQNPYDYSRDMHHLAGSLTNAFEGLASAINRNNSTNQSNGLSGQQFQMLQKSCRFDEKGVRVNEYIRSLQNFVSVQRVDENEVMRCIESTLFDTARIWYLTLDENLKLADFIEQLRSRFSTQRSPMDVIIDCAQKMDSNMPILNHIENIIITLKSEAIDITEDKKFDLILRTLPSVVQKDVQLAQVKSLHDLIKFCKQWYTKNDESKKDSFHKVDFGRKVTLVIANAQNSHGKIMSNQLIGIKGISMLFLQVLQMVFLNLAKCQKHESLVRCFV